MQKAIRFVGELIPGFVLALAIATVAYFTAQIQVGENVHGAVTIGSYIGASVIALFIGMVINAIWKPTKTFAKGLKFTSLMNQGDYINMVIDAILSSLLWGALFSILILLLFLRGIRPTIITICSTEKSKSSIFSCATTAILRATSFEFIP